MDELKSRPDCQQPPKLHVLFFHQTLDGKGSWTFGSLPSCYFGGTFKEISPRVRLSHGMDGMQQNGLKLSRGSAVISYFALLCLCMHLLGCSATHLDPVAPSVTNSPVASSPRSGPGSQTFSDIEQMSGWYTYPDQGNPTCSSKPSITANPSLDGSSGEFHLGPTGEFNNCLWPILLGSSSTATHFILDTSYAVSDPSAAQGVEFSSNKHIGTDWYKFSVQCSYHKGIFSVWDTAGALWSPTSIPCTRPAANAWNHLTVLTAISNGKAVFLSLTFNETTYSINQSFYPITKAASYSFGVHFQMDGNRAGDAYDTYVDQMTFTAW
jgi:hypothetical protein